MAETALKYTRDFSKFPSGRFKPSAKLMMRQILPVGVILVDFLGCK